MERKEALYILLSVLVASAIVYARTYGSNTYGSGTYGQDVTAPTITFVSPSDADGASVTRNFTYINVTVTDIENNVDTCTLEWDGVNESMTKNATSSNNTYCFVNKTQIIQAGTHTYRVFANDSVNNTGASTRTINISVASISVHETNNTSDRRFDLIGVPVNFSYFCYAGLGACDNSLAQDTDTNTTNFTIENFGNSGSGNIDVLLYSTSNLAANWYICSSTDASDGDNSDCVSPPAAGANGADHVQIYNGSVWLNISSNSLDGTSYGLAIACDFAPGNRSGLDFRVRVPNGIANTTFNASLSFVGYTDIASCAVGNYFTP